MATLKRSRPTRHIGIRGIALPVLGGGWAVLVVLLVVTVAALWLVRDQFSTPAVVPATAPATLFWGARAAQHLSVIAQEPRPTGSAAHAAVQAYLVDQLAAFGLQPEVQTTMARESKPELGSVWAGTVHNVVARIPGTTSTKALLLGAHYDSVPSGPGAADCGACVATVLETVRALRAGPPLKNDVIVVFQDAEEHDMLGSHAFMDEHPWADDVGLALNFEAQGSSGAALMYVTGDRNGPLMDAFLAAAPHRWPTRS